MKTFLFEVDKKCYEFQANSELLAKDCYAISFGFDSWLDLDKYSEDGYFYKYDNIYEINVNELIKYVQLKFKLVVMDDMYGTGVVKIKDKSYKNWLSVAKAAKVNLNKFCT